ncbi:MAG: AAA family ATPase [Microgenomates group bacterium]
MENNLKEVINQAKELKALEHIELMVEDLKIQDWDEHKLAGCCPFHSEDTASFKWNAKSNSFYCFGQCNKSYDILNHYIKFYKMSSKTAIDKLISESGVEYIPAPKKQESDINKKYEYPNRIAKDRTEVEKYLGSRGISKETLDFFDVTSNKYGNILFNYYDEFDVLTFIKARVSHNVSKGENKIVGIIPKDDRDKPDVLGAGHRPVVYGMDKVSPIGTLYLVEGELEVLSLHEAGFHNVVSVPFGANNFGWLEYNYEWFKQFDSIKVWMDNDAAGIKARREIIVRLGNNKCRFIDMPSEIDGISVKDPNDVLVKLGKEKLIEVAKYEKELPIEGVTALEDAEDFDPETWDGLKTGISLVDDEIINKFYFGTIVTVTGTPGSGKSTLVNQWFITEAIEQNFPVTIFSGEMSPSILRGWVETGMAGREHVKLKANSKFIRLIDRDTREKIINWYRGKIHVLKDDDNNIDTILKRAEQTVMVNGSKIIILDNLSTIALGETSDTNSFYKQTELMNKLKTFAFKYNVLIVLVVHPRKPSGGNSAEGAGGYEMGGSGSLFNLCHYNISVRRYTDKDKKGEKKQRGDGWKTPPIKHDTCVQFYKNRLMGTIGKVDMYFDFSYRFYTKPSELWKRYGWDKDNKNPIPGTDPNNHGTLSDDAFEE